MDNFTHEMTTSHNKSILDNREPQICIRTWICAACFLLFCEYSYIQVSHI